MRTIARKIMAVVIVLSCFPLLAAGKQDNAYNVDYSRFTEQIRHYLSTNRSFKALKVVNEYIDSLGTSPSPQGTFACYMALGEVYMARRDEIHARESFMKALSVADRISSNTDLPRMYRNLARITELNDTLGRQRFLDKAYATSMTRIDSACALMGIAYLYSNSNDAVRFNDVYSKYRPMLQSSTEAQRRCDKWYKSNEAFRMQLENKFDSAYIVRQSIVDPYDRYLAQADYYRAVGNEHKTVLFFDSLTTYLRSSQTSQNIADVAEINAVYETGMLRMEAKTAEQRMVRNIFIVVMVFVLIIVVVLLVSVRKHRAMVLRLQVLSDKLRDARDNAVQANKMKDVFIQNMSHEVRTPLNAVMGFAQLLALPVDFFSDEERQEFCEHIQNNTNLLTMLIDDILNVSDMESGNYKMVLDKYSVNEICRIALSAIKYRVPEGIEVKFDTEVADDYQIETDARRVQQVLINYLTNAIKHTESGSITLSASLTEKPGVLTLAVADTGTGVPMEKAEEIFERFEKLNAFKQGTGLGLNICRVIAEKLHGHVGLDKSYPANTSTVAHGARFIFELPV